MVIGIVATSAYRVENILVMRAGDQTQIIGYKLTFQGVQQRPGPNYTSLVAKFSVHRSGTEVATLEPSKRTYTAPPQTTTEAGIYTAWFGDLYAVLGDAQETGGFAVRIYFNPLVRLIWIGALVMSLGGLMSLSDRRLRVGAPQRSRNAQLVPAE